MSDREFLMKVIIDIKNWGDRTLTLEKRVELLSLLNKYLSTLSENDKLSQALTKQTLLRQAFGCSPTKA